MKHNEAPAPNRRPHFPLGCCGQFGYYVHAQPAPPAAVGEAHRWGNGTHKMKFTTTLFCATLLAATESMCVAQAERTGGPGKPVLAFGQAESPVLDNAFRTYADLTGKTVLRSSHLRIPSDLDLSGLPPDKASAIARIESLLVTNGILFLQDGPHFVRVFPTERSDLTMSPPLRGTELSKLAGQEIIPGGAINFPAVGLEQVLSIYAELRNRTVLRPSRLPPLAVHLRTACPLNRDEAAYAFTTVLELNDIVVVDDGDHFMQVVPKGQANRVRVKAPRARPNAPLLDPKSIPVVGFVRTYSPTAATAESSLADLPRAQSHCAERLLAFYGELAGKKTNPSPDLGNTFLHFATQTPLSREEVLYAIETTLALNQLAVITENDTVRLGELSEPGRRN
jgi:hypothetical protein